MAPSTALHPLPQIHGTMKPQSIHIAGICLIAGGIISLLTCLVVMLSSVFLWFPSYLYGIPVAIYCIVKGAHYIGDAPKSISKVAPILQIIQILNCDFIGPVAGIGALVALSREDARAYAEGRSVSQPPFVGAPVPGGAVAPGGAWPAPAGQSGALPPGAPGPGGMSGMQIELWFFPLAWMLLMVTPRIVINGAVEQRKWGKHFIQLPPGSYQVEVFFPYMFSQRSGYATTQLDVHPGAVTNANYYKGWWMLSGGKLQVHAPQAAAAVSMPPHPPEQGGRIG